MGIDDFLIQLVKYCICLSYDMSAPDYDIPTPKSYIYEKDYSICKQSFSDKKLQDCPVCHSYFHSLFEHMCDCHSYCSICNTWFLDEKAHNKHLVKDHHMCVYCKERLKSEIELQSHKEQHKCSICNKYFHPNYDHMWNNHSHCFVCRKWFLDKKTCDEHLIEQHMHEKFGKIFKSKIELQSHKELRKCPLCNEDFNYFSSISLHMVIHHSHCSLCNKWFLDKKAYNEHLVEEHQPEEKTEKQRQLEEFKKLAEILKSQLETAKKQYEENPKAKKEILNMLKTAIEDCEQSRFTDFYKQKEKMLNLEVPEYIFSSLFTKEELETIETKFKTNLENENMRYEKGKINFFRLYHLMPEKGKYVHKKNMEEFEQNTHVIESKTSKR